ncbi:tellurite resistance TerB family protein [Methylobacterium oryzihabitans]|uniref:Tellurite resistance TerB family protein n=1 Tax=Methylobacterium oryzihabitans TaxID=2499852 RepID=A0A437NWR0_9HYPH|nr:tellurite resistance TerB family protein [Methylobacterium oryzihabitans]RVU14462.1 tellurite resistance TerB family protein [Methylobacterium oryzihabitans]
MFDAKRLLDQFLGGGGHRGGQWGGHPGPSSGAPLDQLARSLSGDGAKGAILGGLASLVLGGRRRGGGFGGGMMGGGMGGGLGGGMMGGRTGRAGGLAMIASLAYQAYRQWEANRPPAPQGGGRPGGFGGQRHGAFAPVPAAAPQRSGGFLPSAEEAAAMLGGTRFAPASTADEETLARALLTAMIAAAKADGQIDADEQARIFGEMDRHDLDPDDKAFLMDALRAPLDIDAVARLARSPEEATEIYAASVMAIRVDTEPERRYLDDLARRLGLDPGLARHIERTIAQASESAPR